MDIDTDKKARTFHRMRRATGKNKKTSLFGEYGINIQDETCVAGGDIAALVLDE